MAAAAPLSGLTPTGIFAAEPSPGFRWALCNETFVDWPFERICDATAACGYAGIELAPFTFAKSANDISSGRRGEIRRQAKRAGLEIAALHWLLAKTEGYHLTSPDARVRRRTAEYLASLARFCAEVGGRLMVLGSPKQRDLMPGVDRIAGMHYAAEVLRAVEPVLEQTGVVIGLEPLSPKATNFLTTAAEGVELVRRVATPHCRLHLDCLAMATETTPIPDLIRRHRAMLVHFHANDPNGQGPGFGKLDFVPILNALREIDYRGWVSVEVFDYSPGGERLARESIRYLRQCADKVIGAKK
jgi:sugar phosphate isomerase/epimerase